MEGAFGVYVRVEEAEGGIDVDAEVAAEGGGVDAAAGVVLGLNGERLAQPRAAWGDGDGLKVAAESELDGFGAAEEPVAIGVERDHVLIVDRHVDAILRGLRRPA